MKNAKDIAQMHTLFRKGWSKRKIAAELGISRNTLDRYLHLAPKQSPRDTIHKSKHEICLEWLQEQKPIDSADSATLRQKLANDRNIQVSQRTVERARQCLSETKPLPSQHQSSKLIHTGWRMGPYYLSASGELSLGNVHIPMAPLQTTILLILATNPNQLVSREDIAKQLWPGQASGIKQYRNVRLGMHRLRQVFALGPLGTEVIRGVYRKGYLLNASVERYAAVSLPKLPPPYPSSQTRPDNPFYGEVHDYWPNRDPYKLPRQAWLLQQSVQHDPSFERGYLELCYFQILQCFWGMQSSQAVLPSLQKLVQTVDTFTAQPSGWLGIKAEVQSLVLWQPRTSQRLYGTWVADTLPTGMPLMAWARNLIFTGQPQMAIQVLKAHVHNDLCQGWLVLAMAYCAIGDLHSAEEAIHRQLTLDATLVGPRLFLAVLLALRGESDRATRLVLETGILDRPFQGVQALAAYILAQGAHHQRADDLLNEAMARLIQNPAAAGGLGYWGLAALALERDVEAIQLLKLSVRNRCYSAPVLFATPFLKPYANTPAYRLFVERMRRSFPIAP